MTSITLLDGFIILQYAVFKTAVAGDVGASVADLRERLIQASIALPRVDWGGWSRVSGVPYGALVHDPSAILSSVRCAGMA